MSYNPERRKRIDVLALCPSAYIDNIYCKSVLHVCRYRDPVPYGICEGFGSPALFGRENVTFLFPKVFFNDHDVLSLTFSEKIENVITEYLKN